jgi:hypothetical protein
MSDVMEKVEKDIKKHGWHVLSVFGESMPSFSYTIGFQESLRHPEIIMSGLDTNLMHHLLNDIGNLIKKGQSFSVDNTSNEVLKDYLVKFVSVSEENSQEYLRAANAYYGDGNFQVLQCIWPDNQGRFPSKTDETQEILS